MKNIHVLSTDKPSRLWINNLLQGKLELSKEVLIGSNTAQHIYITSDEEIKEGDWYLIEFNGLKITQCTSTEELISIEGRNDCKKIILTTDQDLIKDGVQAIDDEFLEWFVKNPSCEYVEVDLLPYDGSKSIDKYWGGEYKIIIPQEEPKQDTMKTAKELIGQHVKAIGSCGMQKGQEVFGILSEDKGDWIVNIIDEDGFEMPCSVYYQTVKEA